ncbi:YdeI/OmpD-associated family protein [Emticicia sp. 17c]|uniref:YdeI/OmpD-associated family protein n=1 Tax=Emticicia sp. 17c TaxID=3127704 RepID=UPI00301C0881
MNPVFFAHQSEFRKWLAENHLTATEILVGFYKLNTGKPSLTWSQSVDEALCFGWIDGIRKSIDHESYSIRFTPRKPNSIWSAVNIKKVEELTQQGLMQEMGLRAYARKQDHKSKIYTYEKAEVKFSEELEEAFKAHQVAWDFFQKQAPFYKRTITNWVMSAKQQATQLSRFGKLIQACEDNKRL